MIEWLMNDWWSGYIFGAVTWFIVGLSWNR